MLWFLDVLVPLAKEIEKGYGLQSSFCYAMSHGRELTSEIHFLHVRLFGIAMFAMYVLRSCDTHKRSLNAFCGLMFVFICFGFISQDPMF